MEYKQKEDRFFDRPIPKEVRDPFLNGLTETVTFVKQYLEEHPKCDVTIVGDYDSDGITATTILYWVFKKLGITATLRLPHRFSEGYGLSPKIIDEITSGLVITVDNGIAAAAAIEEAKRKGLSVVVIDHHLPPQNEKGELVLPPADIILDPHINPELSEFEDYCGAGLAYRFAKEMFPGLKFKSLMALASIGTVTDVMPLVGANHTLVKDGLAVINKRINVPGLNVLLNRLGMDDHIKEDDYGFKIGPVFNASGRLFDAGAEDVLRLLVTDKDDPKAPFVADRLIEVNEERKRIVKKAMETMRDTYDGSRPIVLFDKTVSEGVIGIIAGQFCEEYNCPTIVFTETENPEILKGSGRSIPEVHLKQVLDKCQGLILGYGGHAGAAGLSVKAKDLNAFTEAFKEAVGELPPLSSDVCWYDEEIAITDVENVCEKMAVYAPYGEANPKPVFRFIYDTCGEYRRIGDGSHLMIKDPNITIMGFGLADEYENIGAPKKLDMVGSLNEEWWQGSKRYKFEILAMKPA